MHTDESALVIDRRTSILTSANVSYGLIPEDHWKQPSWINEKKAAAARKSLMRQHVLYAGMQVNHHNKYVVFIIVAGQGVLIIETCVDLTLA